MLPFIHEKTSILGGGQFVEALSVASLAFTIQCTKASGPKRDALRAARPTVDHRRVFCVKVAAQSCHAGSHHRPVSLALTPLKNVFWVDELVIERRS